MPNAIPTGAPYDVILINSSCTGYAALCPAIPGAVSLGSPQFADSPRLNQMVRDGDGARHR